MQFSTKEPSSKTRPDSVKLFKMPAGNAQGSALALWFGTVSMFKKEGFSVAAPFGRGNVLMTRT